MCMGHDDEAIAAYDDYLARAPDDHDVLTARADLLMLMGRLPEAAADWQAITELERADMQAQSRELALIYEHMQRLDAADAEAQLVLGAQPADAEMMLVRIRALMRAGDDKHARELLDRLGQQP